MEITGKSATIVRVPERTRPDKSEVGLLLANADKAKTLLNWTPAVRLEEGLRDVAEFISQNRSRFTMDRYVI
jgi:nucleoside-diphosphate-sugar epimerase